MTKIELIRKYLKSGQSAVEYILMLLVVVVMLKSVMVRVQEFLTEGDDSFLTQITKDGVFKDASYQLFTIKR